MSVYGFSRDDHRRVSEVVRYVENNPLGNARKGRNVSISDPFRRGVTTSVITERSGDTPGEGTARLNTYNRETNTLGLTDEFTIKNDLFDEFPEGAEAILYWYGGYFWIIGAVCP